MSSFDMEAIREALPIEQVLELHGMRLRRGRGPCPFCGTSARSSSFSVRARRFRCFACNEHGDVVDLVATLDQLPLGEAIRRSAGLAGLSPAGCPRRPGPRPKSAWQIARDALDGAWRPYLAAIQVREFVAAHYEGFVRRRGGEHQISVFVGQLLGEAYDRETLAEYWYICATEDKQ